MCLFVIDPGEGMPAAEIEQGIQSIAAGFDTAKMEPILDRLT
jgi:hypothetical protein